MTKPVDPRVWATMTPQEKRLAEQYHKMIAAKATPGRPQPARPAAAPASAAAQPSQETAAERSQREAQAAAHAAALKLRSELAVLCQQYGQPAELAEQYVTAGMTSQQARIDLQERNMDAALAAAQALH